MSRPTNCINCGAPLEGSKCLYCKTEYSDDGAIHCDFDGAFGTLNAFGKSFNVYLGSMEAHTVCTGVYRNERGQLTMEEPILLHKFTLIESNFKN